MGSGHMAEMTEAEFWDRLRRQFLAIASLIEKRYLDDMPRSEEPRTTVPSHRR